MLEESPPDRDIVAGLEKGLAVIEAFGSERPRLSLSDVAKLTGLTRAAARRYLLTLVKNGYAASDGRFFWLAPRVLKLGYAFLSSSTLAERVQPYLENISAKTGESSSAAILDGTDVIYLARFATSRIMSVDLSIGSRLPAYCTALGRAFLAHIPEDALSAYLHTVTLAALTPNTKTSPAAIREALQEVRARGFALVDQELELGFRSIAVPVFDARRQVVLAINISVPTARMGSADIIETFVPILLATQQELRGIV